MYVYKMLCINRIREYKRLITNLLIPLVSLVITLSFVGYWIFNNFFLIIKQVDEFGDHIYYFCFLTWMVYVGYNCFVKVKPVITIKPASLFFLNENELKKLICIKLFGMLLKHFLLATVVAYCINDRSFNKNFGITLIFIFSVWNSGCLLAWKVYHKDRKSFVDFAAWFFLFFPPMFLRMRLNGSIICLAIWAALFIYDLIVLEINVEKYDEEMRFAERILVAQNYNNTVLLNQYAKEKKLRNISKRKKISKLLVQYPVIWKAKISIFRLSMDLILGGVILFIISFSIYKIPILWSLPVLEQYEIRCFLLIISVFAVFQISLQSMLKQMDGLMQKSREGLFLPLSDAQIIMQFSLIPIAVTGTEGLLLACILQQESFRIICGTVLMMLLTLIVFLLNVKHRDALIKGYHLISVIIFIISVIVSY